jgi:hydroxybutyrate-dimer hydrolase
VAEVGKALDDVQVLRQVDLTMRDGLKDDALRTARRRLTLRRDRLAGAGGPLRAAGLHRAGDTNHKYDAHDYRAVSPEYGTRDDFDRLAAEAKRGMKLVLDGVFNQGESRCAADHARGLQQLQAHVLRPASARLPRSRGVTTLTSFHVEVVPGLTVRERAAQNPLIISMGTAMHRPPTRATLIASVAALALINGAACASDGTLGHLGVHNDKPLFLSSAISSKYYGAADCPVIGVWCGEAGDDLLTGGLGAAGLLLAAPAFAAPLAPTPAELRRNAIHVNYRAVLDILPAGGYGTLYGPNVSNAGVVGTGQGKIAGWEHIAYAGEGNVTLMVQVPASFDPSRACIVTATSSGSRGVYGAIGASGEWGLKQGCAVAYTDKGTGNGLHDLTTNQVGLIDGVRADAAAAGSASHFTAALSDAARAAFNAATPNRIAYKHAHSQRNPEQDWGKNTLQAIRFAFYVLNERYGALGPEGQRRVALDAKNTLVIASGISNGATAALAAAEQDVNGLIDGVAVTEPNAQPRDLKGLRIVQGGVEQATIGKPLMDYFSVASLLQPCAAASLAATDSAGYAIVAALAPSVIAQGATRCASLAAKGLVAGASVAEQSADARAKLRAYGWLPDSEALHLSHYARAPPAIAVTYSNAYASASVADNLCGFSLAASGSTGDPVALSSAAQAGSFSNGNGIPPTVGVNLVYNNAANSATPGAGKRDILASSPSTGALDLALDGALCQRALVTGSDALARRVQGNVESVQLDAKLRGKPTLIVHGRADALIPVNHASRAYFGAHQLAEGSGHSATRYVEVTNAQHFDSFLGFGGYAERYVPLHVYLIRALNDMHAHLTQGAALPPSQVVRTLPRGAGAPAITAANVPPWSASPSDADRIGFEHKTLTVPD